MSFMSARWQEFSSIDSEFYRDNNLVQDLSVTSPTVWPLCSRHRCGLTEEDDLFELEIPSASNKDQSGTKLVFLVCDEFSEQAVEVSGIKSALQRQIGFTNISVRNAMSNSDSEEDDEDEDDEDDDYDDEDDEGERPPRGSKNEKKPSSCVIVAIDTEVCRHREGFELQILRKQIFLVGQDFSGLLYGLYTLTQMLITQYNGKFIVPLPPSGPQSPKPQPVPTPLPTTPSGNRLVQLTSQLLSVFPSQDIHIRAVMWSYYYQLYAMRHNQDSLHEWLRLLSVLRINTILLSLDYDQMKEAYRNEVVSGTDESKDEAPSAGKLSYNHIEQDFQLIRTIAQERYGIQVIPVMTINGKVIKDNNLHSYLESHLEIVALLSMSSLMVVLDVNSTDFQSDVAGSDEGQRCLAFIQSVHNHILQLQHQNGIVKNLYIVRNEFVRKSTSTVVNLFRELTHWQSFEWAHEVIFPSSLQNKPVACIKDFTDSIVSTMSTPSHDSPVKVFTMHTEQDFICPDVMMKFYLSWYACATYFGNKLQLLLDATFYPKHLDNMLTQLILPTLTEDSTPATINISKQLKESLMAVLNPKRWTDLSTPTLKAERAMWSLFLMNEEIHHSDLPSPEEALRCYRFYRQVLSYANYKASTQKMLSRQQQLYAQPQMKDRLGMKFEARGNGMMTAFASSALLPGSSNTGFTRHYEFSEFLQAIDVLAIISRTVYLSTSISASPKEQGNTAAAALSEMQTPQQKRAAVYDNVDMSKPYEPKIYPKNDEITELLTKVVQQNILFRGYKSDEHSRIVEAFECVNTKAGEIVIKQGDSGEYFYITENGKLDVYMESCGMRIKVGRTLTRGDYFGELALMYNTPRAATVISTEASTLWRIDRLTYRMIVTHHNKITSDEFFGLVSNVCILGKRLGDVLSPAQLNKVVSTVEIEEFEPHSVIIRQHQTGDYFYIISEGTVDVWQETAESKSTGGSKGRLLGNKVATLTRGDYFGEKALLADDVRQASCIAVTKVICLSLSRDDFITMIGSWQDITDVNNMQNMVAKQRRLRASVYDSQYHVSIALEDIEKLNVLGIGAFGRVQVARHKESGQLYALKYQSKSFIVSQNMQEMVLNEMHIMKQTDHAFISKLHAAMQDRKYIYFLLELLPGGEFFSFLQSAGKLSEERCRFYSAAVILALEELHKNKIAYRDLKPENMVMDSRGYVKLVDFGLAKHIVSGSTWTMCGTPDYLAPEIILNKGHNHAVDYWALGVLMFEMVQGWPPFYHDQPLKVYEKIILGKVNYPDRFSKALEDIIAKFLVNNPSKRLGNMKGGVKDIIKHKWFGSFDWQGLLGGTLMAPHIPDLAAFDSALAAAEVEGDEEGNEEHEESDWFPDLY